MVDTQPLKERVWARIDAHREEIIALGEDVRLHPELGFKEFRTAALVADRFRALGLDPATGLAVTGVRSTLHGARSLATVAYMGEMDSIVVRAHPDADPVTGAAHACGHNAQVANLVALACGLVLCLVYPHRAILDDPVSAALGFTGMGAVLFGLIWRLLTEGEITRGDSPRWPMPARVMLYCASALLAGVMSPDAPRAVSQANMATGRKTLRPVASLCQPRRRLVTLVALRFSLVLLVVANVLPGVLEIALISRLPGFPQILLGILEILLITLHVVRHGH